jgi:hypothetical protein
MRITQTCISIAKNCPCPEHFWHVNKVAKPEVTATIVEAQATLCDIARMSNDLQTVGQMSYAELTCAALLWGMFDDGEPRTSQAFY